MKLTTTSNVNQDRPVAFLEEAECLLITGQSMNLEVSEGKPVDTLVAINLQGVKIK